MRPTFSIIFFTVISGCGFGLLFLVGVACCVNVTGMSHTSALTALGVGMLFAATGLASSLLHLGQPQRAWRALSQWQSSWLSREGVASILAFAPALVLFWILWKRDASGGTRFVGAALMLMSFVTVVCTAGIYTSLKTIRAWHNALVTPGYLCFGASSAMCWMWMIVSLVDAPSSKSAALAPWLVLTFAAISFVIKLAYWRFIDTYVGESTPETATGLGRFGKVSTFESPHTEENYLTTEMGFVLARKHASRLRVIAVAAFAIVPAIAAIVSVLGHVQPLTVVCAIAAALGSIAGLFVERWLFFAQAKHLVMLYYTRFENA
jgi:sulfite dehydrogenase (quinone) subunit SoeC